MTDKAYSITAGELAELSEGQLPDPLVSSRHLIYNSPAALAYNSPGAQGFGVKRAGLAVPGSVMLLVSPGCCGRNTTVLSQTGGYGKRFFYYLLDETDIVTGRHLKMIPQAVYRIVEALSEKPSMVMICLTCVDALLGTDMEVVCRQAQEQAGLPVRPCYMYALTREGKKPPMVHVRESIYSLLEPAPRRNSRTVNILGHFAPLTDDCELYDVLHSFGITCINEISRMKSYDQYLGMSRANFNLVLNAEALPAAEDLSRRLGIPYIFMKRMYRPEKMDKQYQLLAGALGQTVSLQEEKEAAAAAAADFRDRHADIRIAVGEACNANAFELSLALLEAGLCVTEIFANISREDFFYIRQIAAICPQTRIYSNLEPTMLYYDCSDRPADLTIGKDAAYYHPRAAHLAWNEDIQPFGFSGIRRFYESCQAALAQGGRA